MHRIKHLGWLGFLGFLGFVNEQFYYLYFLFFLFFLHFLPANEEAKKSEERTQDRLSVRGRALVALIFLGLVVMWSLGLYAYDSLPERIPMHFDFSGKPTSFGDKQMFIFVVLALSITPVILLLLIAFRFVLFEKYPYLLNLPAFFSMLEKIPKSQRKYWINIYFEYLAALGFLLTLYLLVLEWGMYVASFEGRSPTWFIPFSIAFPVVLIFIFFYWMKSLSHRMEEVGR